MQIHNVQRKTKRSTRTKVGRGGTRGKTSGRGHKGQKQHGGTPRPELRDIIKKLPKKRGYKFNSIKKKPIGVNVATLDKEFSDGESVDVEILVSKGIVRAKGKKKPTVKILGTGDISKKLIISGCIASKTAQEKIEKAGGSIK